MFTINDDIINSIIEDLGKKGDVLSKEETVAGFIGVDVVRHDDGSI